MIKAIKIIVYAIIVLALIYAIVFFIIFSVQYDISVHGNWATMLSGFWSAAATAVLGVIAIWQNYRYKKLSDENNKRLEELTIMPECYLESIDINKTYEPCKVMACDVSYGKKYFLNFRLMNLPMIDITVNRIFILKNKNIVSEYQSNKLLTNFIRLDIFESLHTFSIQLLISSEFMECDFTCEVVMQYRNIYGNQYEKVIKFDVLNESTQNSWPKNIKQEKAKRSES